MVFFNISKEYLTTASNINLIFILLLLFLMDKIIYNKLFLKYYINSPNFLKRNKDMLIVGITSAVIGTVLGGLIVYLLTKQNAPHP
jgi:hypothetical protein